MAMQSLMLSEGFRGELLVNLLKCNRKACDSARVLERVDPLYNRTKVLNNGDGYHNGNGIVDVVAGCNSHSITVTQRATQEGG